MNNLLQFKSSIVTAFCEIPLRNTTLYRSIEIQSVLLEGQVDYVVLLYAADGALTIAHPPSLDISTDLITSDPAYSHLPIKAVTKVTFDLLDLKITDSRVSAIAKFIDLDGHAIDVAVESQFSKRSRPCFTPAPRMDNQFCLRFMLMSNYHFIPARDVQKFSIDGKDVGVRKHVLPRESFEFSAAHCGSNFMLLGLTQTDTGLALSTNSSPIKSSIRQATPDHWIELTGLPPVPTATDVNDGPSVKSGSFAVNSSLGRVCEGEFELNMSENAIVARLNQVRQSWFPGYSSFLKVAEYCFRNWLRKNEYWEWRCELGPDEATRAIPQQGKWVRLKS